MINQRLIKRNIKENFVVKKACVALVLVLALFLLCGCEGYVNSYSATILITSCYGDEASMEFDSFKGTYHFKLKRDGDAEHTLDLESSLAEGEMNVYIGVHGDKGCFARLRAETPSIKRLRLMKNMMTKKRST
jgi:hypothetical protein